MKQRIREAHRILDRAAYTNPVQSPAQFLVGCVLASSTLLSCSGAGDSAAAVAAPGSAPTPVPGAPIVLIVLDALHAGHIGHLGHDRDVTPTLDELAADGISFTRALAPAPYTLASIPSLLTGRLPDVHGLVRKDRWLVDEEVTLAEVLSTRGYRTFGAVANPNGSSLYSIEQGFDVFHELFRPGNPDVLSAEREEQDPEVELELARASEFLDVTDRWLKDPAVGQAPFFFYLHFLEPHSPYAPPEPWRSRWLDPEYDGPFASGDSETLIDANHGEVEVTPADVRAVRALYDANLAFVDDALGQLFERLRAEGHYERSWIVVTSDHGEAFWQHGRWGHNDQLFEEMLRVPLIVKPPTGAQPERGLHIDGLVSIIDIFPSLCEWVGAPPAPGIDGRTLSTLWNDPSSAKERELFLRTNADFATFGLTTRAAKSLWLRSAQGETLAEEHYELTADPDEFHPLPSADTPHGTERITRLRRWARTMWEADQARRVEVRTTLSTSERALLQTLGYEE